MVFRKSFLLVLPGLLGIGISLRAAVEDSQAPIWNGTYTAAQALRGKENFTKSCERCHLVDLSGGTGPSLKGTRFMTSWENESLYKIFTKIRDTMPPNFGTTLTDDAKLDVLSYILQVNGFPEGSTELKIDADLLDNVQIVRKGAARPAIPNFSVVAVVGCLAPGPDKTWLLTNTSEPEITKDQASTPDELQATSTKDAGKQTLRLISVNSFKPESHAGQKVQAKGLIYRDGADARLNVTSLQVVASSCL